jgi:hypothetical protein
MAATVPVSTVPGIVGRWIVSAGDVKERAPEKNKDQFPFPEAARLASALYTADWRFRWHQSRIVVAPPLKSTFIHLIKDRRNPKWLRLFLGHMAWP